MEHTKADEIATRLEEDIATGVIAAGTVLRQEELSREFDVSRTPVREALRRLAASGLAEFVPNRGVRVRALDRHALREMYLVRSALEGLAAELAAPIITDAELSELHVAEEEFARCTRSLRQDLPEEQREPVTVDWLQANFRFHDIILGAADSQLLAQLTRTVRRSFAGRTLWRPGSEVDRRYEQMVRQHAAIREALAARSPRGARELSSAHAMDSWGLLEHILEEVADRPPALDQPKHEVGS